MRAAARGLPPRAALARALLALAAAAPGALPALAQPVHSALIIGISRYADADVPLLAGVPHDIDSARAMARAMGISDAQTTVLRDAQAGKAEILDALDRLTRQAGSGGRVLVYFSGHGTRWYEPALRGCKEGLLTHDRQALSNEELAQRTRRLGAQADKLLVMFDACHSEGVAATRAVAGSPLTPKFFRKDGADTARCAQPSNLRTRGLLAETTRLGGLRENFVQISSSRADEVSFDEPAHGGVATQAVRDCLLGAADDRDASGAVTVDEVAQCAQAAVERKLRPYAGLQPHHITVSGNRNIVPVPTVMPVPAPAPVPAPDAVPVAAAPAASAVPAASAGGVPAGGALASLATLRDIEAQRDPRRRVQATLQRNPLKIGRDALALTVRAGHDGYVYVVLLGSDRRSFQLLFPNALDRDNALRAGAPLRLPRPGWDLPARGPAGTDHLLVLVADTPRDLAALGGGATDPAQPYSLTLNHLPGRRALLDFFAGHGVTGATGQYGAQRLSVREVD